MVISKNKIKNKSLYTNLNFNCYLLKYLNIYKNNSTYQSNYYLKKNVLKNLSKNFLINNYYLFINLSLYNLINNDLFFFKIEKKFNQNKSLKNFYHNKNLNFWRYFDFIYYNKNNNIGNLSSNSDYFNKFTPKTSTFVWSLKNCAKIYVNVSPNLTNLLTNISKKFIVNKFIGLHFNNLVLKNSNNFDNYLLNNFFDFNQKNYIQEILNNYLGLNNILPISILQILNKKKNNTFFLKNIINNYLIILNNIDNLEKKLNLRLLCCMFKIDYLRFKELFNSNNNLLLQLSNLFEYSLLDNSEVKQYLTSSINSWLKCLLFSLKKNGLALNLRDFLITLSKNKSDFLYSKIVQESIDDFNFKGISYPNILYLLTLFNNNEFLNLLLLNNNNNKVPLINKLSLHNTKINNNNSFKNLLLLNNNNKLDNKIKFNQLSLNKNLFNLKYKINNFIFRDIKLKNNNKSFKNSNSFFNIKFIGSLYSNNNLKFLKNKLKTKKNISNFNNNKINFLRRGVFNFINDFRWLNFYSNSVYNIKQNNNHKNNKKLLNNKTLLTLLNNWYKVGIKPTKKVLNSKNSSNSKNSTNLKNFDKFSKRSFILNYKYNQLWGNIPIVLKNKILYTYLNNNNFKFNKWFENYLLNLTKNFKHNNSSLLFKLLGLFNFNVKHPNNKYNKLSFNIKPKLLKVKNKYDNLLYNFSKINFFDEKKKLYNKKINFKNNKFNLSSFLKLQLLKRKRFYNFNKKYKTFLLYFWKFKQFNNLGLSNIYWNKFHLFLKQNLLKNRFFNKFYHKKRFIWWDNKIKVKFPFNLNRFLLMNIRVKKNNTFITITDFSGKILLVKQCGALRATQRRYRNTFTANERLGILIKTYLNRFWWLNKFSTLSDKDKAVFKYKKFKRKLKKKKKLGKEPITMEELSHLGSLYNTAYYNRFVGSKKSKSDKDKEKDKSFDKDEYKNNKKLFLIIKMNFGVSPAKCLHIYRKFKRYKKLRLKYNIVSVVNVTPIAHNGLRGKKHRRKKARKRKKKI